MVLENIFRHGEMGKDRVKASTDGARRSPSPRRRDARHHRDLPPRRVHEGLIGKFLFQFGVTMSVAVALSLLEALTLTPPRCSQFLNLEREATPGSAGRSTGSCTAWRRPIGRLEVAL